MGKGARRPTPYHVVPGPAANKRILLISYHAPPSNKIGARRWAGMARYFAERGWGFDVLAVDPSGLSARNESLLADLPPGTRLFGVPDEASALDRLLDGLVRVRQSLAPPVDGAAPPMAVPDSSTERRPTARKRVLNVFHAWRDYAAMGRWARRAAQVGRLIFDPALHQLVISSSPPHMSHEGGRLLSSWTGLPFIADFRDSWRFQELAPFGPAWIRLATKYETRAVGRSALVVANVEPVRSLMQRAYPRARVVTITNGMDEESIPASAPTTRFIIGHPGTVYFGRDPEPLFEAVREMVRDLGLGPEDLSLEFMGYVDSDVSAWLGRLAIAHEIEPFVVIHEGRPRPGALEFMATCSVLVALQPRKDLLIPAKVFECMRFPAWLLLLAGPRSAAAQILAGTGADVLDPHDIPGIRSALSARYREFRSTGRPAPLGTQERFTRRFQAGLLLDAMEEAAFPFQTLSTVISREHQSEPRQP